MRYVLDRLGKAMRASYEPGTDDPWWFDNTLHLLGGALVGTAAHLLVGSTTVTVLTFLLTATVWECFEYAYNIRPWDERENWSVDRAIEDTLLDTVVGLAGVYLVILVL